MLLQLRLLQQQGGANSIIRVPDYKSNVDLRLTDKCAFRVPYNAKVTKDIDGNTRNSSLSFAGANEAIISNYDAGVVDVLSPVNPVNTSTNYDVKVVVKNFGSTTISSIEVGYELNGNPVSTTVSGLNLNQCDTAHVIISAPYQANFSTGVNKLRGFTGMINNTYQDQDNLNDTSGFKIFCALLSGNYTLNPAGSGGGQTLQILKKPHKH
jgi:hypothetical protein